MKPLQILKGFAVGLAVFGMSIPGGRALAGPPRIAPQPVARTAAPISDVVLAAGGTLTGQVVDLQGNSLSGAPVVVWQDDREIARAVSDDNGTFHVSRLRSGLYQISAGQGTTAVRLWSADVAPPAARDQALVVAGDTAVRGQYPGMGAGQLIIIGGIITAVILAAVAINQNNEIKNDLDNTPASP